MNIQVQNLTKKYLLKTALNDVTVQFEQGKIHALVGENGAGKSTLASILSGDITATSGKILLDQKEESIKSTFDSLTKGIVHVHQRPLLAEGLSAIENIILKNQTSKNKSFIIRKASQELIELKNNFAPKLNLNTQVKDLGGNMRFYISLLGSLLRKPKVLILDEPSAFLSPEERKFLYKNLRELSNNGMNIIVITHSTEEASAYPDTITVLKEGRIENHFDSKDEYKHYIYSKSESEQEKYKTVQTKKDDTKENSSNICIEYVNISSKPRNKPVLINANITVCYGEISVVTGIKEAAIETLEDTVTAMNTSYAKGKVILHKQNPTYIIERNFSKKQYTTSFLRKNKTAIIPSDKTYRASNPKITVSQMLSVYENGIEDELIKKAEVSIEKEQLVSDLSGGMLQRLILERELSRDIDYVIMCNPMHGLDTNAQRKLTDRIQNLARCGKAILLIGAEDFPLALCSRVYEMESGRTKGK